MFWRLSKSADIKALIAEDGNACVYYDYATLLPSVPVIAIASVFRAEAGRIALFHTHFNPIPFVQAKESGEVARVLQALQAGKG